LLDGTPFRGRIVSLDAVDSTNDACRRLAERGAEQGTVVIAEEQTAGRGRHGQKWHSAPGIGLYISVLFRPPAPVIRPGRWTLGVALAAAEACEQVAGVAVTIKWPNDLMHGNRKLGGALAELRGGSGPVAELIVGTGINVETREEDLPSELRGVATSLRQAGARSMLGREQLAAVYLQRLWEVAQRLLRDEWEPIARRWLERSPGARDTRVRVRPGLADGPWYEGRTMGIDPSGALRVRRDDGTMQSVMLPESVRPIEE
jgi:BirA family biotin operon repressor/biotin-[acetyl-CoA-carboxylase] ligase